MLKTIMLLSSLLMAFASAAEDDTKPAPKPEPEMRRVMLDFRGQTAYPGDYIDIGRELNRRGYNPNRFKLDRVFVSAERGSYGLISLSTNRRTQDRIDIERARRNGRYLEATLINRDRGARLPWDIHFSGRRGDRIFMDYVELNIVPRDTRPWICTHRHAINKGTFTGRHRSKREAERLSYEACKRSQPRVPNTCEFRGCRR